MTSYVLKRTMKKEIVRIHNILIMFLIKMNKSILYISMVENTFYLSEFLEVVDKNVLDRNSECLHVWIVCQFHINVKPVIQRP